ncbi:MAG: serine/threonine protein kinase [Candidatus Hydrogenedentota bacterium]
MSDKPAKRYIANRYQVQEGLGRGGIGKVYRVYDHQTGRELALKMLRTQWVNNDQAVSRFLREMETVKRLDHPGIVKVYDTHREGNQIFYTMEYVRGKTLRAWLNQRGRLDLGSAVRVLCLVAHALEHAHRITIHRDLSPENVMILRDGSVRLLDFGLAKIADAEQVLTMVGASLGKLQYVAPEQRTDAAKVDHRADIYSLGIIFFEMLTGQRPDMKHSLLELRPDLHVICQDFLSKATAAHPHQRFQSARELRQALLRIYEQAQAGEAPRLGQAGYNTTAPRPWQVRAFLYHWWAMAAAWGWGRLRRHTLRKP